MARMSLPTPTLDTGRLRLRPFTDSDADALYELHSNAFVLRYWDSPPWTERARADKFLATCQRMTEEGSGARVVLERRLRRGLPRLVRPDAVEPGLPQRLPGLLPRPRRPGARATRPRPRAPCCSWAFDTLDLNRVQAEADTRNAASARVLEKLGFVHEGTLREDCVVNGDVSDSWVYGLLRREWRGTTPG